MRHGSGLHRDCVVPEVSRVHHVSAAGGANVKKGSKAAKLLDSMMESSLPSGFLTERSTEKLLKPEYDKAFAELVSRGEIHSIADITDAELDSKKVYIIPYLREEYQSLVKILPLYPSQPRAGRGGVIIINHPVSQSKMLLVDRRRGEGILPDSERRFPRKPHWTFKAGRAESCDGLCQRHGLLCDPAELEYVNNCEALKKVFPCENGCGHQVGQEIPAYVHEPGRDTYQQCLVTDDVISTCDARHHSTTRLCRCYSPR